MNTFLSTTLSKYTRSAMNDDTADDEKKADEITKSIRTGGIVGKAVPLTTFNPKDFSNVKRQTKTNYLPYVGAAAAAGLIYYVATR